MPSDLVPTARELLAALGSNTWTDGRAERLIETFGQTMGRATPGESHEALALLASGLNSLDPEPAGVASRVVGAMIESGHDPQPARSAMLGALQQTLPVCASMVADARTEVGEPAEDLDLNDDAIDEWLADQHAHALNEVAGRRPKALEAWQRLHEIWPGAIALLSVDPAARAEASDLAPVAEDIEEVHEAAGWLRAMLTVLDEEPYVAIEPATRTGIVGRMSGIVENFQLNTLLMDEFPRDEPRVSKEAVAVARGNGPQQIDETVTGVWNLYSYGALLPGGELARGDRSRLRRHVDLERGHARRHPGARRPPRDPARPGVDGAHAGRRSGCSSSCPRASPPSCSTRAALDEWLAKIEAAAAQHRALSRRARRGALSRAARSGRAA